jgi:hypothetical protein
MEKTGYIYVLVDPRTGVICYVGQTQSDPIERLAHHWRKPTNAQIAAWFADLRRHDLRPIVRIIERVYPLELRAREDYWIGSLFTHKAPLLNTISWRERQVLEAQEPWGRGYELLTLAPEPVEA